MFQFFRKSTFLISIIFVSFVFTHAKPCQDNKTSQQLHEWAVQSHREFWVLVGQMAGYEARNEAGYQYVKSPSNYGLNYVYLEKGFKDSDRIMNMMKDRSFTIFFESDDDDHMFKYITHLKESDNFTTMGMDLRKLAQKYTYKPGLKVWKVTTDAEFEQWLKVSAARRTPNEEPMLRKYFSEFKPSKNNPKITFFLGSVNGQVVGSSLIYFSENFASLYWVGVHPDHRRHGLGTALSFEPLKEAIARGYRWTVLQAMPLGVPVYPRIGFEKVGIMKVFYFVPSGY
jgi:ribosomal protein S18 acetylase RimI-like enzyme